jgi:predicted transcriptional regulator
MATTTIQVSQDLVNELKNRKMFANESYEEIIWDLIEDTMELSKETKKNIKISEQEIKEGKTHTHEEVKKALGL